ncbi:FecR domain-containing protein [Pseudomonas sp. NPDC007930]|uniref:FecR domain-containing protein n=1 Tax=Pseudomonas sp. NPDC007930 TaxID=3364417 RepID=UPI0036E5D619
MSPSPEQVQAVQQAARWYARLQANPAEPRLQQQWLQWCEASELNRQAWQRVQAVSSHLAGLPARVASPALRAAGQGRRQVLLGVAWLAAAGGLASLAWRSEPARAYRADYRTGVGEQARFTLADGSELLLDTDSAVDVRFDGSQRLLLLRRGQVLASTASERLQRPFSVRTRDGEVLALGTRFSVRVAAQGSEACVLEKAVQVTTRQGSTQRVEAGQSISFAQAGIGPVRRNPAGAGLWAQGHLVVVDQPLAQVLAELGRYRPGVLRCSPEVAALRVSGTYPVHDTDLALVALSSAFALEAVYFTRYWVRVQRRC